MTFGLITGGFLFSLKTPLLPLEILPSTSEIENECYKMSIKPHSETISVGLAIFT